MEPVVVDLAKTLGSQRYNGGWIKKIDRLNKRFDNGYSHEGDFARTGLRPHLPGLYVDCDIAGSRKNQTKNYTLFELKQDRSIDVLHQIPGGGLDWAVHMWEPIEAWFAAHETIDGSEDIEYSHMPRELRNFLQSLSPEIRDRIAMWIDGEPECVYVMIDALTADLPDWK